MNGINKEDGQDRTKWNGMEWNGNEGMEWTMEDWGFLKWNGMEMDLDRPMEWTENEGIRDESSMTFPTVKTLIIKGIGQTF